jgi:hypothetical protein
MLMVTDGVDRRKSEEYIIGNSALKSFEVGHLRSEEK